MDTASLNALTPEAIGEIIAEYSGNPCQVTRAPRQVRFNGGTRLQVIGSIYRMESREFEGGSLTLTDEQLAEMLTE